MICSELPGRAALQPNLLLVVVQSEEPVQHMFEEVMSTVFADVLAVSVCAVRFDGAIVNGEVKPVAVWVAVALIEPSVLRTARLRY
jgi:hypothetical protein